MDELLNAIDDVRQRTNVDYATAKKALDKSEGDVLEAIIYIEQKRNLENKKKVCVTNAANVGSDVMEKIKELIKQGNVNRILVKRNDTVIMNIPVTAGIIGALVFTYESLALVLTAFATGCRIYVVNKENEVIDVKKMMASDNNEA